ncbi:MAG: T9SS type A sorting domain-containing protein [Bacteroidetes bacterium]|nr:T9SS type A sorting domain-containing protein [Bacteroidota bacterium]
MNNRLYLSPVLKYLKTLIQSTFLICTLVSITFSQGRTVNGGKNNTTITKVVYEKNGNFYVQSSSGQSIANLTGTTNTDTEAVRIYKITYTDGTNSFDIFPTSKFVNVTELNSKLTDGDSPPSPAADEVTVIEPALTTFYTSPDYEDKLESVISIPDVRSYWDIQTDALLNGTSRSNPAFFMAADFFSEDPDNTSNPDPAFFENDDFVLISERNGNSDMGFRALAQNGDPIGNRVDISLDPGDSGPKYQWNTLINHGEDDNGDQPPHLILFDTNQFFLQNGDPFENIYGYEVSMLIDSHGDGKILGFENPGTLLLNGDCWRMLSSSPFQGTTYAEILDPIWTQALPGSDEPNAIGSNVFLWDNSESGNTTSGWTTTFFNGDPLDLTFETPPGTGFLVSVFDDDNFDAPGGTGFPKELTVEGIENSGPIKITDNESNPENTGELNSNDEGWTLLGNPFGAPLIFSEFTGNTGTSGIQNVAYVYDRNWATSEPSTSGDTPGPTNGNIGGWRTTDGTYGDIEDGRIAPFQGFFVQNDETTTNRQVTFEEDDRGSLTFDPDDSIEDDWYFYGKNKDAQQEDYLRLYVEGEQTYNSAWITISSRGSTQHIKRDAYELEPFSENFSMLSTRKGDELFDIGHFPNDEETIIPLNLETTLPGRYKLKITESNLIGSDLVFTDTQENVTLPLNEDFEYEFEVRQAAKANPDPLRCGATGQELAAKFKPKKAKVTTTEDRFIIQHASAVQNPGGGETPSQVQLNQNYPNPFNPTTQISYSIPQQSNVLLEVYDLTGKLITTLVNESVSSGTHSVTFDAANLSSGVYMYRLQTANRVLSRKLTVIK